MSRTIRRQFIVALAATSMFTGGLLSTAQAATPTNKSSPQQSAQRVDELLAHELFQSESAGAPNLATRVNDTTYLRRVTLDLIGELPAPEEITSFALDPSTDKRAQAVSRLLERPALRSELGSLLARRDHDASPG